MSVAIETVGLQLHMMASVFRRKVSSEMVTTYHAILDRHVGELEFVAACEYVLEHEDRFPAPALLLTLSKNSLRNRREIGEPWLRSHTKEPLAPLSAVLNDVDHGRAPVHITNFRDRVEQTIYEIAHEQLGGPARGETHWHYIARLAEYVRKDLEQTAKPAAAPAASQDAREPDDGSGAPVQPVASGGVLDDGARNAGKVQ